MKKKIKVFLSSRMDGDFVHIRTAIWDCLEKTNYFDVYAFEKAGASSTNTKNAYLREIQDSDVVLILIDNRSGINQGVAEEIKRAKLLKKKMIYIFSKDQCSEPTYLQKELINMGPDVSQKFIEVDKNEDIIEVTIESLVSDVINEYIYTDSLLSGYTEENSIDKEYPDYKISRSTIKDFDFITEYLHSYFYTRPQYNAKESTLNRIQKKNAVDLLKIILGEASFHPNKLRSLEEIILSYHAEEFHNIIKKRILALNSYLLSDFASTIDHLRAALAMCHDNIQVPNWFKLDIAIDLRNVLNDFDRLHNQISAENEGQKLINESTEPLFYPYIDRQKESLYQDISRRYYDAQNSSPYSQTFRNDNHLINAISNSFIVAMMNVSIINMDSVKNQIIDYINLINYEYGSNSNYLNLIKLLILSKDDKSLSRLRRRYNFNEAILTSSDISNIIRSIEHSTNATDVFVRKLILLKNFGYLFDNDLYKSFSNKLFEDINTWIEDENKIVPLGNIILSTLSENTLRLDVETLITTLLKFFDYNIKRWYIEVCRVLALIDYDKATKQLNIKVKNFILNFLDINSLRDYYHFDEFIVKYYYSTNIDLSDLKQFLVENYTDFFQQDILINSRDLSQNQVEGYIMETLESINKMNQEQGQDGVIYGYSDRPYSFLRNLLLNTSIEISNSIQLRMMDTIKETLFAPKQTSDFKIESLYLVIFLNQNINYNTDFINSLKENKDLILNTSGSSLFTNDSVRLLEFVYTLTLSSLEKDDQLILDSLFFTIEFDEYETIQALKSLERYLHYNNFDTLNEAIFKYILHFASLKTNSSEKNIRIFSIRCLVELIRYNEEEVLEKLYFIMNNSTPEIKSHLIGLLNTKDISEQDYLIKIFQQARLDENYLVRYTLDNF
ncbi:DUF4062 domain-containing protein [Lacicoccus alkaliphilus]|uniref:DUF4062 domain-containing protein n=1 Tax=Lacicoccus alkaliphilus DSM 16010 TaxID=1123231 RepID=A0A1M7CXW9_9BACL|nr:DUF4062 domain-containing protein [Salinicoccus alkaliphilus]SHL71977.1 protein of unknown function [Salinicoccus alkaliphilus DSM 16010]